MPADLPITRETESVEEEMARWMAEFQVRPGDYGRYENDEVYTIADHLLEEDPAENEEFMDELSETVESIRSSEPVMHRLPVMHVSRENLGEVMKHGELPENFMTELHQVTADYINGFIPGQEIQPPEKSELKHEPDSDEAGTYSFRRDRSRVYSSFGSVLNGSSAGTVSIHETMHKNNTEAILDDPDLIRDYARIYSSDAPESYTEFVQERPVARVKENLLAGLALFAMDQQYTTGIMPAYVKGERGDVEFPAYTEEFRTTVRQMEEKFELEHFDIRDESICQSVSFFMNGHFEQNFETHLESKQEFYNNSEKYSPRAGDGIATHLRNIKQAYEEAEGSRGQRFKQTMEKRIPFLNKQENFHKYDV